MLSPGRFSSRYWTAVYPGFVAWLMLPLGGCGYVTAMTADDAPLRHDTSTVPDAAVVVEVARGVFDPICRIERNEDLHRAIIVEAGTVQLQVECSRVTGVFGEQTEFLGRADIVLQAEPGRRYRIAFSEEFGFPHVAVSLALDGAPVIHRSMLASRFVAAPGVAHVTLVARSGPGIIPCKLGRPWADRRVDAVRRSAGSFASEPYSHQIIAECSTYAYITGDVKERYEAPVDFEPVPGRLYTVHMTEEDPNLVFVTDVSSDVQTIAYVRATRTH